MNQKKNCANFVADKLIQKPIYLGAQIDETLQMQLEQLLLYLVLKVNMSLMTNLTFSELDETKSDVKEREVDP